MSLLSTVHDRRQSIRRSNLGDLERVAFGVVGTPVSNNGRQESSFVTSRIVGANATDSPRDEFDDVCFSDEVFELLESSYVRLSSTGEATEIDERANESDDATTMDGEVYEIEEVDESSVAIVAQEIEEIDESWSDVEMVEIKDVDESLFDDGDDLVYRRDGDRSDDFNEYDAFCLQDHVLVDHLLEWERNNERRLVEPDATSGDGGGDNASSWTFSSRSDLLTSTERARERTTPSRDRQRRRRPSIGESETEDEDSLAEHFWSLGVGTPSDGVRSALSEPTTRDDVSRRNPVIAAPDLRPFPSSDDSAIVVGSHPPPSLPPSLLVDVRAAIVSAPRFPIDPNAVYLLRFDGGSRGNPGLGGAGAVLYRTLSGEERDELWYGRYLVGLRFVTSNVAEYAALLVGLRCAATLGVRHLRAQGDSELVVKQTRGEWRCRKDHLRPYLDEVRELIDQGGGGVFESFDIGHIPRAKNRRADELANATMDKLSTRL